MTSRREFITKIRNLTGDQFLRPPYTDLNRPPYPGAIWNGATWEHPRTVTERRIKALEEHIRNLEDRYADLENRLLYHSQGRRHASQKSALPPPDYDGISDLGNN